MNSLTNSFHLNSPFISSAFLPSQVHTNSVTNFLKSQSTPFLEKSPLFIQNSTFERQLLSTGMERSALSSKESGIFSNPGSATRNPMIIKFDIFSPTINKYNFTNTTLSINQNFFQMENNAKKPNSFGEINTFLFNQIPEKQGEAKKKKKKRIRPTNEKKKKGKDDVKEEKQSNKHVLRNRKKPINSLNSFSNKTITNVINNNYVFEVHHEIKKKESETSFLKKKRGIKSRISTITHKVCKLKKKDKTVIKILLNQIKIQGITLNKFPLIPIPEESLFVEIFQRLVYEGNYFEIDNSNEIQNYTFSQQRLNKKTFNSYFHKEKQSYSSCLYLIDENENEEDPYLILQNYYTQIKNTVLQIQKNFIGKKKGILNKEETNKLYKLILSCNFVIEIILNYKPICYNKINIKSTLFSNKNGLLRKLKNGHYKCPFCVKCFTKGQGLGGHMSRHHPKQSEKYKEKIAIRERRTSKRMILMEIKSKFFANYDKNYKEMLRKGEKNKIQAFLINHKSEYLLFRKKQQKLYRKPFKKLKTIKSAKAQKEKNSEKSELTEN